MADSEEDESPSMFQSLVGRWITVEPAPEPEPEPESEPQPEPEEDTALRQQKAADDAAWVAATAARLAEEAEERAAEAEQVVVRSEEEMARAHARASDAVDRSLSLDSARVAALEVLGRKSVEELVALGIDRESAAQLRQSAGAEAEPPSPAPAPAGAVDAAAEEAVPVVVAVPLEEPLPFGLRRPSMLELAGIGVLLVAIPALWRHRNPSQEWREAQTAKRDAHEAWKDAQNARRAAEKAQRSANAAGLGAAIGATVGTAALGPVGTVLGGAAGALLFGGKSYPSARNDVRT
eukprot:COSAG04_NODE_309_length_17235_cov_46.044935_13_plen_293_part_00